MRFKEMGFLLLLLAFLVALHQYLNYGVWFEMKDVHHELFIATFAFAGFLLLWLSGRRER
jgi:hypothetical protein